MKRYFIWILVMTVCGLTAAPVNLALGKRFTASTQPANGKDLSLLTDGKIAVQVNENDDYFRKPEVVLFNTWRKPLELNLDLGENRIIDHITFSTSGSFGQGGVMLPFSIRVYLSDDGKQYRYYSDMAIDRADKLPDWDDPKAFNTIMRTKPLSAMGRHLKLVLMGTSYFYCDEIEIWEGKDSSNPGLSTDNTITDDRMLTTVGCIRRFSIDVRRVKEAIANSKAGTPDMLAKADELAGQIRDFMFEGDPLGVRFKAPFNDLHKKIYALYGELLSAEKKPEITIWRSNEYLLLRQLRSPDNDLEPLKLRMVRNEHRPAAFNLSNNTAEPRTVKFKINGIPQAMIQVKEVEFSDTMSNALIGAALAECKVVDGIYQLDIPAGMISQVWIEFRTKGVVPGSYKGEICFEGGKLKNLPLTVDIYNFTLPENPSLESGLWDYALSCKYGITKENAELVLAHLSKNKIAPWESREFAALPKPQDVDSDGNLLRQPDFSKFDSWVGKYRTETRYHLFLSISVNSDFAGTKRGTAAFNRAVASWAKAWKEHCEKNGLAQGKIVFHLLDEPSNPEMFYALRDWSKAFKEGAGNYFLILCNPNEFRNELLTPAREALQYCDILMPRIGKFLQAPEDWKKLLEEHQSRGGELQFYDCSGPTRIFDPDYYRTLAWYAARYNGRGASFWQYQSEFPWNEYLLKSGTSYPVVFLSGTDILSSKSFEALQEGRTDFEYIQILKARITALRNTGQAQEAARAEAKLNQTIDAVIAAQNRRPLAKQHYLELWNQDLTLSPVMARAREEILNELIRLEKF